MTKRGMPMEAFVIADGWDDCKVRVNGVEETVKSQNKNRR